MLEVVAESDSHAAIVKTDAAAVWERDELGEDAFLCGRIDVLERKHDGRGFNAVNDFQYPCDGVVDFATEVDADVEWIVASV